MGLVFDTVNQATLLDHPGTGDGKRRAIFPPLPMLLHRAITSFPTHISALRAPAHQDIERRRQAVINSAHCHLKPTTEDPLERRRDSRKQTESIPYHFALSHLQSPGHFSFPRPPCKTQPLPRTANNLTRRTLGEESNVHVYVGGEGGVEFPDPPIRCTNTARSRAPQGSGHLPHQSPAEPIHLFLADGFVPFPGLVCRY